MAIRQPQWRGLSGPRTAPAYGVNTWTGEPYPLEIDPINWGLHVVDSEHHEIHEGASYTAYYTRTTANTDGHRSGLYIKTPPRSDNTLRAHLVVAFAASHAANLSVCEGVTIAANVGTHTGVIINRHRDLPRVSQCRNNATPPAVGYYTTLDETAIAGDGTWATGTVLRIEPLRAGGGPNAVGGVSRGTEEYVLKADTAYVFLLTNTAANLNTHWIFADWYEHRKYDH